MASVDNLKSWFDIGLYVVGALSGVVAFLAACRHRLRRIVGTYLVADRIFTRFGSNADQVIFSLLDALELAAVESSFRHGITEQQLRLGMFVCDRMGNITWVNQHFANAYGVDRDACTGFGWVSGVHPDDRDVIAEAWRRHMEFGLPFERDYRIRNQRSGKTWLIKSCAIPHKENGEIALWRGWFLELEEIIENRTGLLSADTPNSP